MTIELIAKFTEAENIPANKSMKIDFKKRNSILGQIIKANDYADLKSKNFWRIVPAPLLDEWKKTKNINLAKIYNGTEFTKLSLVANKELTT
ncbi:MAG: short-chain dehydrogenase [Chitinophagaceae bacterium]